MSKQPTLPPDQYLAFNMGRMLIIIVSWLKNRDSLINDETAMLIDFLVRQPRQVISLFSGLKEILESNELYESDLSDLFARQQLGSLHEEFYSTIAALEARGLISQVAGKLDDEGYTLFEITDLGRDLESTLNSRMSFSIREISSFFSEKLKNRNPSKLEKELRSILPDQSMAISQLAAGIEEKNL